MAKSAWQFCTALLLLIVLIALSGLSVYLLWHIYETTDDIDDKLSGRTSTTSTSTTGTQMTTPTSETPIKTSTTGTLMSTTTRGMPTTTGEHNVSHTKGWKDAARIMKSGLNESADPCGDFFQFACGGWIAEHPLQPHQLAIDVFTVSLIETITLIKDMLMNVTSSDLRIYQAAKNYYTSCVQSSFSQTTNREALVDTITQGEGFIGFPMITEEWNSPGWKKLWQFMATVEIEHGVGSLFQSYVSNDMGRPKQNGMYLYQANVAFARVQYINPYYAGDIDNYRVFVVAAATILAKQANVTMTAEMKKQIADDAADLVAFEARLAYLTRSDNDQKNFTTQYNPFTLTRMKVRWPAVDWHTYYDTFLRGDMGLLSNRSILVNQPAYIDALNGMLMDPDNKLQRTVANFINWRFVYDNSDFMYDEEFSSALLDYRRALYGVQELPPSELGCAYKLTDTFLPLPVGRLYVDQRAETENMTETRGAVREQIDRIVTAFLKRVRNLDWMDEQSKENAVAKANNLVKNVGYPDWILDDSKLEAAFAHWSKGFTDGSGGAFWSNIQFAKRQQMLDQLAQLDEPVDRHSFGGSGPTAANAWYQPRVNSITFALAILQSPFWRVDFPQAINYGDQGGTAGHELTHGFDDSGVQFFVDGRLHTWVDLASLAGFEQMAQCIVGQYGSHCCPKGAHGMCADGMATQGENIADVGGQAAAYDAYIDYVHNVLGHDEPRMPGLEQYDMRQMFWISYAHTWCGVHRPEALVQQLLTDPHAPDTCRTNLVLRDLPQFGKDFNCEYGVDFMYPKKEEICVVW